MTQTRGDFLDMLHDLVDDFIAQNEADESDMDAPSEMTDIITEFNAFVLSRFSGSSDEEESGDDETFDGGDADDAD